MMDRLTALLKRLETTPDVVRLSSFKPEILGDCTVGDLRHSLSQEAVRDEVLENVIGIAGMLEFQAKLALNNGKPDIKLDAETIVPKIVESLRALKREPNAERCDHDVVGSHLREPPAAPDVAKADDNLAEVGQVLEMCRSMLRDIMRRAPWVKTFVDDEAFIINEINPALVKLHQAAALLARLGQIANDPTNKPGMTGEFPPTTQGQR